MRAGVEAERDGLVESAEGHAEQPHFDDARVVERELAVLDLETRVVNPHADGRPEGPRIGSALLEKVVHVQRHHEVPLVQIGALRSEPLPIFFYDNTHHGSTSFGESVDERLIYMSSVFV